MRSVTRDHHHPGERGPDTPRAVTPPTDLNGAWLQHIRRVASGEDTGQAHAHDQARPGAPTVQRVTASDTAGRSTAEDAGHTEDAGRTEESGRAEDAGGSGKEIIARLSSSIELHTVQTKSKRNIFAPGTWWPEQWLVEGPTRLRKTLDRRVLRGEAFNDQDLSDIRQLSDVNPKWLKAVGIGTYADAEAYLKGDFKDWLRLSAGKRVLTATLAVRANHPAVRAAAAPPISPDYTLGRFMLTQASGTSVDDRKLLEAERDQQIRDTAIDSLYPAGIAPERRHAGTVPAPGSPIGKDGKEKAPDYVRKDTRAREMLTKILLVLRNGLKLYDPALGTHKVDHEQDVIRALAHGGRVNVRIPALSSKDEAAYWLPHFLGVTKDATKGETAEDVSERDFATHRTSIGANKGDQPGKFKEKGGILASVTNKLAVGAASPKLWGQDISGGGLGSKDWNGDMVLPNGSYGHILLVYHRPTMERDGSLQIGIETIKPHADSPVGYEHDFRSTEATSNPESVLHGHKGDKVGSGGLGKNERFVDLREMGASHADGDWRAYLDEIQQDWEKALARTEEGSQERRALYEELVGPRPKP
ncbi:PE-PGRS family protein [Streptomyces arenae]|uniref:PE-PGRS family protein n=1 Tax=Streptomyces arenae TaxID=29301 RepID=UPI002659C535|nr:PE-PGRS family protein [Streptomyces arenae]MCG7210809.1 PE-PGRS family protein [Streptomyces arenae]